MLDKTQSFYLWSTIIIGMLYIINHIEDNHSRPFAVGEEPAVQSFPRLSKVTPNAGVTLANNIFLLFYIKIYAIWL